MRRKQFLSILLAGLTLATINIGFSEQAEASSKYKTFYVPVKITSYVGKTPWFVSKYSYNKKGLPKEDSFKKYIYGKSGFLKEIHTSGSDVYTKVKVNKIGLPIQYTHYDPYSSDGVTVTTIRYWKNGMLKEAEEYGTVYYYNKYGDPISDNIRYKYRKGKLVSKTVIMNNGEKTVAKYKYDKHGSLKKIIVDGQLSTTFKYKRVRVEKNTGSLSVSSLKTKCMQWLQINIVVNAIFCSKHIKSFRCKRVLQ